MFEFILVGLNGYLGTYFVGLQALNEKVFKSNNYKISYMFKTFDYNANELRQELISIWYFQALSS